MSFSHDIEDISRTFVDAAFEPAAAVRTDIVRVTTLPASRVAQIRYASEARDLSVFVKQLHSRSAEEHAKHRELIQKEAALLEEVSGHFVPGGPVTVVQPLACFPDMLALVTKAEEGIPLDRFVKQDAYAALRKPSQRDRLVGIFGDLGRWLRDLEGLRKPLDAADFLENRRQHVAITLERLASDDVVDRSAMSALVGHVDRAIPQLLNSAIDGSLFHGDFLPGNVFVRPGGVVLLDFADGGVGTAYTDLASMVEWLDFLRYKLPVARPAIARVRDAFLDGFAGGRRINGPLLEFMRLQELVDRLRGHAVILRRTPRTAVLHRAFNRLKFRYLLRRMRALTATR